MNDTAFDESWAFNSPAFRSTRKYTISKQGKSGTEDYGVISDDGIQGINVFVGSVTEPSRYQVKDCTVIEFRYPAPIQPGEKVQSRISFSVQNFGKLVAGSSLPSYSYDFHYFDFGAFTTECSRLIQGNLVNFHLEPSVGPGGFSVLLYSPPSFERTNGFEGCKESWDPRSPDGSEGESRTKCIWQMRTILGLANSTDIGPDQGAVVIRGSFAKRVGDEVASLQQKVNDQSALIKQIPHLKSEVRIATVVAALAILITIVVDLLIPLIHERHSNFHASSQAPAITNPTEKPKVPGH